MFNFRLMNFELFPLILVTFGSLCVTDVNGELFFSQNKYRFNRTASNLNLSCEIPNQRENGTCVPMSDCATYLKFASSYTLTEVQTNFLKKINCKNNVDIFGPLVCCPKNGGNYTKTEVVSRRAKHGIHGHRSARRLQTKKLKRRIHKVKNSNVLNLLNECGKQVTNRIYGGEIAELDEYPWLVLLVYKSKDFGCSGTLIDDRHVLTAAHCVHGQIVSEKNGLKNIRLGEFNVKTQPDCIEENNYVNCADSSIEINVDKIIIHPDYNEFSRHKQNDIAIIRLEKSVPFTNFIMPICLPRPNDENPLVAGNMFSVSGWGRTDIFNQHYPNIRSPLKLKLRVPIVDLNKCMKILETQGVHLCEKQICAGGELGKDTCSGDSGGPLMHFDRKFSRWVAYGIVSFGFKQCGLAGRPAVYTNILSYMDWITKITMPASPNLEDETFGL